MVNVCTRRCSHETCLRRPSFNVQGSKTAAYCEQHARDGMIKTGNKRGSHRIGTRKASIKVDGGSAVYWARHADGTMVDDVHSTPFSNDACARQASGRKETDGASTACSNPESDMVDGVMTNDKVKCNVAGCEKVSAWGLCGEQASRCCHNGPLQGGLTLTVPSNHSKSVAHRSSHRGVGEGAYRVKVEAYL